MTRKIPSWIKDDAVLCPIWKRLNVYNKNFLLAIVGEPGSGKSWSGVYLANCLDRDSKNNSRFTIDRIVFSAKDFINLVKSDLPKGSWIMWEETGVGINSRLFFEHTNIIISYITQTFRYKNYGVIYTVPDLGYVDKQVRKLFHTAIKIDGSSEEEEVSFGKWYNLKTSMFGKTYFPQPRIMTKRGIEIYTGVEFPMAPKKLLDSYEEKKKVTTDSWYENYSKRLEELETTNKFSGKRLSSIDLKSMYDKVLEDPKKFLNAKGRYVPGRIQIEFGLGETKAKWLASMLNSDLADSGGEKP